MQIIGTDNLAIVADQNLISRHHEELWLYTFNANNKLLKAKFLYRGVANAMVTEKRMIFHEILSDPFAVAFAIVHNHPSGYTTPSVEDDNLTLDLIEGAKYLGIRFLDHLIIPSNPIPEGTCFDECVDVVFSYQRSGFLERRAHGNRYMQATKNLAERRNEQYERDALPLFETETPCEN